MVKVSVEVGTIEMGPLLVVLGTGTVVDGAVSVSDWDTVGEGVDAGVLGVVKFVSLAEVVGVSVTLAAVRLDAVVWLDAVDDEAPVGTALEGGEMPEVELGSVVDDPVEVILGVPTVGDVPVELEGIVVSLEPPLVLEPVGVVTVELLVSVGGIPVVGPVGEGGEVIVELCVSDGGSPVPEVVDEVTPVPPVVLLGGMMVGKVMVGSSPELEDCETPEVPEVTLASVFDLEVGNIDSKMDETSDGSEND